MCLNVIQNQFDIREIAYFMTRSINFSGYSSKLEDLDNFVTEILNEAKSANGTWSLATITKVQARVARFTLIDSRYMIERMLHELNDETQIHDIPKNNIDDENDQKSDSQTNTNKGGSLPVTKYKIAQMFASLKSKNMIGLFDIINEHKSEIIQIVAKVKSGPLGGAISQLLTSLYQSSKPNSTSPPPKFVYQPRLMQPSRRPICSHTPSV
ncbi:hypothetical protein TRFO_28302 [Tritrichomonas foetus]|uniref:Uncharacterized protein n=1 Tax=Tritrichomonas foetus TaxID=1144522 RepID=A0A1J4JZ50_9EUKA|nr:hypothetical protein TRFO_28302 [Tritrichomonas foetus]|eukprot:OHT04251.1 hypothetical protein TRFO_28302 [Tritrichomonas foetus]